MVAFLDRITGKNKLNKVQKIYTKYRLADQPYDIGDHTYGLPRIMRWDDKTKLHIGKFCSIAEDVTIILGGNHRSDWVTTYPFNVINLFFPNAVGIEGHPATKGDITIGNDVLIAPCVHLNTAAHPIELVERLTPDWSPGSSEYRFRTYALPIKIGNGCWIGANVVVLPGVTIGGGAVIGAGSVVTKDIPANVVAVGNPCRVVRDINR